MDILVSNKLTSHAFAWSEFGSSPIIGEVNYRPYTAISILKVISLNPTKGTLSIEGQEYRMVVQRENNYEDRIWFWK